MKNIKEWGKSALLALAILWSGYALGAVVAMGAIDAATFRGVTVLIAIDGEEK